MSPARISGTERHVMDKCIHGGTKLDCKRCNNPYKSRLIHKPRTAYIIVRNMPDVNASLYNSLSMGHFKKWW